MTSSSKRIKGMKWLELVGGVIGMGLMFLLLQPVVDKVEFTRGYRAGYSQALESMGVAPLGSGAPVPKTERIPAGLIERNCKADQKWFYEKARVPYSAAFVCGSCEEYEWSKRSGTGGTCLYPPRL